MDMITSRLPNRDRKPLRLACRDLACATPLSIPRVFLSPNPRDIDVCLAIAGHPGYSSAVAELVWDDSRLPQAEADAMYYYGDLLFGVRPRPLLPLGSRLAGDEEEELMMLLLQSGGQAPHWFRTYQILNDVRLIEVESRDSARSLPATATATGHMSNDWSSVSSSSSGSAHGNHSGIRARLRKAVGWYRWDARRGGVAAELPYDMVSEDEAAAKAARDWQYYVQLLRGRREVEESGAHIAALDTALEAFPRLQTVTVTYIAHGRGGSEQKPVYQTPTIRAFPRGFNYPLPLGWIDGRHGARLDRAIEMISQTERTAQYGYGMSRDLDTPGGLSIVLHRLALGVISAAARGKGKGKEQAQQRPPVELRIDDGGLGRGVDFAALISVDKNVYNDRQPGIVDGRSNYDVLSQIMLQPGFKKLCLQMAGLTQEQCASHLASGAFSEMLGRANGGSGLQRLELAFNAVAKEWWMMDMPMGVPTVPLGKMLTTDNTAAMQHLRLSHMAVDGGALVEVLGRLPDTIKTIVLYDVRLRNAAATGPEDSGEEGWCLVLGQLRRMVGTRWTAMKPRSVLRIGVSGTGGSDGRELTTLGRRRWVGEAGLAAVLYGDNGGAALAEWRAGGRGVRGESHERRAGRGRSWRCGVVTTATSGRGSRFVIHDL
ncbi:hypothetical protein MN608_10828 [Microdochium nivale]|nr:hypothetical protein MN608_10828 [Microdochium nivale]